MRTAFALWQDRIAPVFDTAKQIHVVESVHGKIVDQTLEMLPESLIIQKVLRLVELGIGTLVCGAISSSLQATVTAYGIRVVPYVAGEIQAVIRAWLRDGLLEGAFAMPGCRLRQNHRSRKREGHGMNGRGGGRRSGRGTGKGRGGQQSGGRRGAPLGQVEGVCVCPQCGLREAHQRGVPCVERQCPKCGTALIRE